MIGKALMRMYMGIVEQPYAVAIGLAGGYALIKALQCSDDEEVMEAGAEIAARCLIVRGGFPLR